MSAKAYDELTSYSDKRDRPSTEVSKKFLKINLLYINVPNTINTKPPAFITFTTGSKDYILYSSLVANKVIMIPIIQISEVLVIFKRDLVKAS